MAAAMGVVRPPLCADVHVLVGDALRRCADALVACRDSGHLDPGELALFTSSADEVRRACEAWGSFRLPSSLESTDSSPEGDVLASLIGVVRHVARLDSGLHEGKCSISSSDILVLI